MDIGDRVYLAYRERIEEASTEGELLQIMEELKVQISKRLEKEEDKLSTDEFRTDRFISKAMH